MKEKAIRNRIVIVAAIMLSILLIVGLTVLIHQHKLDRIVESSLIELQENKGQYDEKTIVLKNTNSARAKLLAETIGAELRITSNGRFATLTIPSETTLEEVYSSEEYKEYISDFSLDYYASISDIETLPDRVVSMPEIMVSDESFSKQTYLSYLNIGFAMQSYNGSGVTVAIIDTGIDTNHPEFIGKISEMSYNATLDKVVKDYDMSIIEDEQGHGTAVAGVIGASIDGEGIIGIAPNVNLLVIKVECNELGQFYNSSDLVFGLYYAIEQRANVINMSFGSSTNIYEDAAKLAADSDIICVAAAGNDSTSALTYPAADRNVIGVGALAENSWELAPYSNYGDNSDIVAPGTVYTAKIGGGYQTISGTSFASPITAAAVALYKQQNMYCTLDDVTEMLYASSYDLGSKGDDWYFGYGALDISAFIAEPRGTVTFNYLTDEISNTTQKFVYNHVLQNLPEPERLYSVFDGWYYDIYCTEEVQWCDDEWNQDLTLYANWANEDDGIPYTYVTLDDGTVEIRSYTGHRRYITIPEYIDGKIVSSIGDFAFEENQKIVSVNLPKQLKNIGMNAFSNCGKLKSISIPESVISIGNNAFKGDARLTDVAFVGNSNLTTIGNGAFAYTGLNRFEVPKNVSSLTGSTFLGTTNMKGYSVAKGNKNFTAINGVLYNATQSTLIAYPAGIKVEYIVPESVTNIGESAFAYSKITNIDLSNVVSIDDFAFNHSSLIEISLNDTVTYLGINVFECCEKLASADLGHSLTKIPESTFSMCLQLKEFVINKEIQSIGYGAFYKSGLESVEFESESQLLEIESYAFCSTNIKTIEIPSTVQYIMASAFACDFDLTSISFGDNSNLKFIGGNAFESTKSLKNIILPSSLEIIGGYAFIDGGLEGSINIPENVEQMGCNPFASCGNLTSITVDPNNKVFVSIDGVLYSKFLTSVDDNGLVDWDNTTLASDISTLVAYPSGKTGSNYSIVDGIQIIEEAAFQGAKNISYVELPSSLIEIHRRAFFECERLSGIQIPKDVMQISAYAFANTPNLYEVVFAEDSIIPRLSFAAFANSGIVNIRIPSSVSTIGQKVFENCDNLQFVTFAANSKIENIPAYMFSGNGFLMEIIFEQGSHLKNIEAHAFENIKLLNRIDFGTASISSIGNYAFRYCPNLSSIAIPEGVVSIGRFAFYGDNSLSYISLPQTIEYIGQYAFYTKDDNISVLFASNDLPSNLQENWDAGLRGYSTSVLDTVTIGDFFAAKLSDNKIAILEYLGNDAVVDLSSLNLGGDIVSINGYAFSKSSVEKVILPDSLITIQNNAFINSNLKEIEIPSNVKFIGSYAFAKTPLNKVTFKTGSSLANIEKYAFAYCDQLKTITIPSSVETMGTYAFFKTGLENVTFENGSRLTEISKGCFASSKLNDVVLPNGITVINYDAFRDCLYLKTVKWGTSNIQIMSNAFYNTGLIELNIPKNITYIGEYAFVGLQNLNEFVVSPDNEYYKSIDGVLFSKDGKKLIAASAAKAGEYIVPNTIETIGFGAFENSNLSSVKFANGINLLTIGYRAFYNADEITRIEIPASVVSIDYYAFAMCDNLQKVEFADGNKLTGIYEGAFYGCKSLYDIVLPESIVEISDYAFCGCVSLTHLPITESSSLLGIYDYAFAYTGIEELNLPISVNEVGKYAFKSSKLKIVNIPSDNADNLYLNLGIFEDCNELVDITLPFIGASFEDEDISWIGYVFGAASSESNNVYLPDNINTIHISEGITAIYPSSFYKVTKIQSIDLPKSVCLLYENSFSLCESVYSFKSPVSFHDGIISCFGTDGNKDGDWSNGLSGTLCIKDLKVVNSGAFNKVNFTEIIFEEGLEEIKPGAFGWVKIQKMVLPSTLKKWETNIFDAFPDFQLLVNNSDLVFDFTTGHPIEAYANKIIDNSGNVYTRDVDFIYIETPDNYRFRYDGSTYTLVAYLGNDAVNYLPTDIDGHPYTISEMRGVQNVIIPESFTTIPQGAFYDCKTLKSVVMNDSVTCIETNAFYGCSSLSNVELSANLKEIGYNAFCYSKMKEIILPEGLVSINDGVFSACRELKYISIPNSVEYIGKEAFSYCDSLEQIYIGINTQYMSDSFKKCPRLNVVVDEQNPYFKTMDNVVYTINGEEIIFVPENVEKLIIPGTMKNISSSLLTNFKNLKEIVVCEGVESIESMAFMGLSKLEKLTLPDSIKSIGYEAFLYCDKLEEIYIGRDVIDISERAFESSGIITINVSNDNTNFVCENGILMNKSKTKIYAIESDLSRVIIPNTVIDITHAFYGCSGLNEVLFEEDSSLETIGWGAFELSGIVRINLPEGLKKIEGAAFFDCRSLTEITLPSTLEEIGVQAFANTSGFWLINNSDISIDFIDYQDTNDDYLYNGHDGLLGVQMGMITYKNGTTKFRNGNFEIIDTEDGFRFYYDGTTYKLVAYLGDKEEITLPLEINGNSYRIYHFSGAKVVNIPEGITNLDDDAFSKLTSGNRGIEKVILPSTMKQIGYGAFWGISTLKEIVINSSEILSIGPNQFGKTPIWDGEKYWINDGLYINNYLFDVSKEAVSFALKPNTTCVATGVFENCNLLKYVEFGGDYYFVLHGAYNLEKLVLTSIPSFGLSYYFFDVPQTLKMIVLKDTCDIQSNSAFDGIFGVTIFVDIEKDDCPWDDNYYGWNNGNKVYYKGEWSCAEFYDEDGNLISKEYYPKSQLVRQPVIRNTVDLFTEKVFVGWDIDGDGYVDYYPATIMSDTKAYAVMEERTKTYTVTFYDTDRVTVISRTQLPFGSSITCPETPTRRGYIFTGWSGYSEDLTVNGNLNIYAVLTHVGDGHHYEKNTVSATCTAEGYDLFTCKDCGESYKENIVEAKGHSFGNWSTVIKPGCETDGLRTRKCSCGEVEEEIIDSLGHSFKSRVVKKSTCQEEGIVEYKCSSCSTVVKEYTAKLPHTYVKIKTSVGFIRMLIEKILNIFFGYENDVPYYYICKDCGHICTSSESTSVMSAVSGVKCEHQLSDWETIIKPTIDNVGVQARKCLICEQLVEAQTFTSCFGEHKWGDWNIEIAPDCVNDGEKERICSECGNKEIETITKLGHNYSTEWTVDIKPTCTTLGSKSHHCTRCESKVDVTAIEKLAHKPLNSVEENRVEATCTTDGSYDVVIYCESCHGELSRVQNTIKAIGHKYGGYITTKNPTCTDDGSKKRICSICLNEDIATIEKLGHNYSTEWMIDKESTCKDQGEKSHHCTRCDSRSDITILELAAHTPGETVYENVLNATCTVSGSYDAVVYCSVCHIELSRKTETNAYAGHKYGEWIVTKEATCTEDGSHHRICATCQYDDVQPITKLGHNYLAEWTVDLEPTCTSEGSKSHHCTRCESKVDVTAIEKLAHKPLNSVEENRVEATCTTDGSYDVVIYCESCHGELSRVQNTIKATGHKYGEWIVTKEATCTEDGSHHRICATCQYDDIQPITKLGHNYSTEWTVDSEPTCTSEGSKSHHCTRCESITDITPIEKVDHEYSTEYTVDIPATITTTGIKSRHCLHCDAKTDEQVIPMITSTVKVENTKVQTAWGIEFTTDIKVTQIQGTGAFVTMNYDSSIVSLMEAIAEDGVTISVSGNMITIEANRVINEGEIIAQLKFRTSDELASGNYEYLSLPADASNEKEFVGFTIYEMGDVNMDGNVNARDVTMIKQYTVHMIDLTDAQKVYANVYVDNDVNSRDAVLITQYVVHMPVTLGDRVDVEFIVTEEVASTNENIEAVTVKKSVHNGTTLVSVPTTITGYAWSSSISEYVVADFNEIKESTKYYLWRV